MASRHEIRELRELEIKSKETKKSQPTKKRGRPKKNAKK